MDEEELVARVEEHLHILPLGERSRELGKVLSNETGRRVLEAIYSSDSAVGLSAQEISRRLGVSRTAVLYHLTRMMECGLVRINPVLETEVSWKGFWERYRRGRGGVSRDQFNRLHEARMKGVKLFVPRAKGFLLIPGLDDEAGRAFLANLLSTMASLREAALVKGARRATSILGALGVVLLLLSFALQWPGPWLTARTGGEMLKARAAAELAAQPAPAVESQLGAIRWPSYAPVFLGYAGLLLLGAALGLHLYHRLAGRKG